MFIRTEDAQYVLAVIQGIADGTVPAREMTEVCPECREKQERLDNDRHLVVADDEDDNRAPVTVVICCEGYWVINPSIVGIDQPTWRDWKALPWEDAGTDEPLDQNAESDHLMAGATSAYYGIGPTSDGRWSLDLVQMQHGDELAVLSWDSFDSEAEAKAAAEDFERQEDPDLG